jgi:hypothetical protein
VLRSHCGGQRYAVNWGLALVTAVMDQRKAEASNGTPAAELTPSLNWSAYSLRNCGIGPRTRPRRGGRRTRKRRTPRAWRTWRRRWAIGTRRDRVSGVAPRCGFPGSRANDTACRAGSPPARSAWSSDDGHAARGLPRRGQDEKRLPGTASGPGGDRPAGQSQRRQRIHFRRRGAPEVRLPHEGQELRELQATRVVSEPM